MPGCSRRSSDRSGYGGEEQKEPSSPGKKTERLVWTPETPRLLHQDHPPNCVIPTGFHSTQVYATGYVPTGIVPAIPQHGVAAGRMLAIHERSYELAGQIVEEQSDRTGIGKTVR